MKKLLLILLCFPLIGFGQNVNIPDPNFKAYLVGNSLINTNGDTEIQVSEATAFNDTIDCSNMNIDTLIGIEAFTALTYLYCSNNNLTTLDVSANTALTALICNNNQLTSLNISTNTALISLVCKNNQLINLDVSANTALILLQCSYNELTSLDVSANTTLIYLWCSSNNLNTLDVSANTALATLSCSYNELTSLDVSANTTLRSLFCSNNNNLNTLDVSSNTELRQLICDNTNLNILDVSQNVDLIELRCQDNNLDSLDVSANIALLTFYCYNNNLDSLDVSANIALIFLYCSNNNLDTLDLSPNTALTKLWCHYNQLTSLNISTNTALISLVCNNNQLINLDVRNGNNLNMLTSANFWVQFTNNPNLTCISVDDAAWADTNWTVADGYIDSTMSFSTNCATAFGCLDSLSCSYDPIATIDDSSCIYQVVWQQAFTICDDENVVVGNSVYTTTGNYTDTLTASNGCDSIVYTNLVVDDNTYSYDTLAIIPNLNMYWNNILVNVSGDYDVTLINAVGCDSIANLNLTVTTTGISDIANSKSNLVKITDMLGQRTPYRRNVPLFYIYDDGTIEKRIVIE